MKNWRKARSVWPAGALLVLVGCAELAMEPDQVPTKMLLAPHDTLVSVGDVVQIRVTVLDQDGNEMEGPPSWAQPVWSISDSAALSIDRDGSATVQRGGFVEIRASLAGITGDEGETEIRLRLNPKTVVLSASAIYLTQGAQNVNGTLPLVANRRALLRVFAATYSASVQDSLFRMGEAVLAAVPEIGEISLAMPNIHYHPIDLSAFGQDAANRLFLPTDEPHGDIEATLRRA